MRKGIPLDTTPVCCVQYRAARVNIACNRVLRAGIVRNLDALRPGEGGFLWISYSKGSSERGLRVIFCSYAAAGPSWWAEYTSSILFCFMCLVKYAV